jgi:hypothetical protein
MGSGQEFEAERDVWEKRIRGWSSPKRIYKNNIKSLSWSRKVFIHSSCGHLSKTTSAPTKGKDQVVEGPEDF